MNQRLIELKQILQLTLNQKSIKINKDGSVQVIYRFKPKEFLSNKSTKDLEKHTVNQLEIITGIKYRVTKTQKEPAFCYNVYVKLISTSESTSKNKLKYFLKYFDKQDSGNFCKTSYQQIILNLIPLDKDKFNVFLNS